jgi:hypothetical protein
MSLRLAQVPDSVRQGPLHDSLLDADYYLTVGRSLFTWLQPSVLGTDANVAFTLAAIRNYAQYLTPPGFEIFGTNRLMDFSQFKVRGYYTRSVELDRYFTAYMWTARIDLRMLEAGPTPQTLRELGTAVALCLLLEGSGQAERWRNSDSLVRLFTGRSDSMTFAQLKPLLDAAGITSLESVTSTDQLAALHKGIREGTLGLQIIPGDVYVTPLGPEEVQLPRSFALTGQRFIPDGFVLAEVT